MRSYVSLLWPWSTPDCSSALARRTSVRRRGRSRRPGRRLQLENLEDRSLLSAAPWSDQSWSALEQPPEVGVSGFESYPSAVPLRNSALLLPPSPVSGPQPFASAASLDSVLAGRAAAGAVPAGATASEGSEFMLGDVWVSVVLLESNGAVDPQGENWSSSRINAVKSEIREGLSWWESTLEASFPDSPHSLNFQIDFTYADAPVPTPYEPIKRPQGDEGLWIDSFLNHVGYDSPSSYFDDLRRWNDDQRRAHGTHWAFTAFVVDSQADANGMFSDEYFAYAYLGGPFLVMTYDNDGWGISRMGNVLAHETAHVFYALDEYPGSGDYADRSGYYNIQNTNAYDGHPDPASRTASLMAEASSQATAYANYISSAPSLQMLGWKDADSDGIFDVLDVPLSLAGSGAYNEITGSYEFAGSSSVNTLLNPNPYSSGRSTTINTVDLLQYRVDGGVWTDGNTYGSYTADVAQQVPVTTSGQHTIDFRTIVQQTGVTSPVWSDTFNALAAGEIHGTKWQDADGDGVRDGGEAGLPGWTVYLDADQNSQLDAGEIATTTGANGNYSFTDLVAGTYTVAELQQPGWGQTFPVTPAADLQLRLDPVVTSLSGALAISHAADGSGRLFVAEQGGRIKIVRDGSVLATPFLNLSSKIVTGGERGLLGLAFHPDYAAGGAQGEGKFYVYYSAPATAGGDHDSVVAEYQVSAGDANLAQIASERVLLRFTQPFSNHNGGDLHFGPDDGLLYISTGDGGGAGDPGDNAQNRANLLGNILRIDVDGTDGPNGQYSIHASNPFVGQAGVREEIWAYGFRNPFRMSFDDGPGGAASPDRLFVGDVGQNNWEEVDLVTAGGNYGWRYREGLHPFTGTPPADLVLLDPIAEYANPSVGISVIGGQVYRGREFPELREKYLFGDLNGRLMALEQSGGSWGLTQLSVLGGNPIGQNIRAFGTDEAGELYLVTGSSLLEVTSLTPQTPHTVMLAADHVVTGIDFGNQLLAQPPQVADPMGDVVVDEDAADTVIDLATVFDDPDPGDLLTYTVNVSASASDVAAQVRQASYTHIHQDLLYTHAGDNRGFGAEHDLARDNIADYFTELGLATELDPFTYSGQTYYNVVATLPGATRPDDIYVVGAHYDSVNNPGADDNGSGTAAVMELARVLSQFTFDATIQFIAFDREEQGLYGSAAYASEALARGDQIQRMVNLDMVGYNPGGLNQVRLYDGDNHDQQLMPELLEAFNVAGYGGPVTAIDAGTTNRSDHYSFDARGYDAALIIESAWQSNPHYHKATDSVETDYIDYAFATNVASAVAGYLAGAAGVQYASSLVTATVDGSQLVLDWGADQHGSGVVTVRATDAAGLWVEDAFAVTVNPVADPPAAAQPLADVTVNMNAPPTTISLEGVFSDPDISTDGDSLSYSLALNTNPGIVNATLNDTDLILTYETGQSGVAEITVRATDASGLFVEDTVLVTVSDVINTVWILDNSQPGFSQRGSWTAAAGGFEGGYLHSAKGSGNDAASWTFENLPSGLYRVSATWLPFVNRASDAPFTITSGSSVSETLQVNQELAPDDFADAGAVWEDLGGLYPIAGGTLTVRLTDEANEYVIADAIRVERVGDLPQMWQAPSVLDNGEPGFASSGVWPSATGGFDGSYQYNSAGSGGDWATWTFTGLPSGLYRVASAWVPFVNRATDAPFTILDGSTAFETVKIDQEQSPADFSADGVAWEILGGLYPISSGTLTVRLNDAADEYVIADAVRIERLAQTEASPEIQVLLDTAAIADGSGSVDFGSTPAGVPVSNTFTVVNVGNADLTLVEPIGLPAGFSLVSSFGTRSLSPGSATTFVVQLDASGVGTFAGEVSFANGDGDENPFNFLVQGQVVPSAVVRLIDNADVGFTTSGAWTTAAGGFQADYLHSLKGNGSDTASWTFDGLTSGLYRVSATWVPFFNRATDSPFTVADGNTVFETVLVNQELAPDDFVDGGTAWEDLGGAYPITGNTLTVRLSDAANEYVIADAVRIERVGNFPSTPVTTTVLDHGQAGTSTSGVWPTAAGGFGGSYQYNAAGSGQDWVTWTFTGLPSGLYRVFANWLPYVNRATNAPFTVLDATAAYETVQVNQQQAPDDLASDGVVWEALGGLYQISSGILTVRLTDAANAYVIADAIRIERLG